MNNKFKKTTQHKQWFSAILITIATFLTGTFIIIAQSIYSYDNYTVEQLSMAVSIMERKLESTDELIQKLMPLVSAPCKTTQPKLMDMIVRYSGFQTLNIVHDNAVSCSTHSRMVNTVKIHANTENNKLYLFQSNVLTPGDSIGSIQVLDGSNGVLVTFNGKRFHSILENVNGSDNFQIDASIIKLNNQDEMYHPHDNKTLTVSSQKYGFNINTQIGMSDYINEIKNHYLFIILLVLGLSLLIGRYVFLNVRNNSSFSIMKESLANNEFTPYAQPIMDSNGTLAGLEILIRWNNKHLGIIYPDTFIPLAEASGLIIPMTTQLMDNTFQTLETVTHKLPDGFHVGINISALHLDKTNHLHLINSCQKFKNSLLSTKARLILELTEREVIEDYNETQIVFDTLHEMGINIAIDDFGTGHSTLSYIKNLSFDFIKIDKSFIDLIGSEALSASLVDNIVDLAKRLDIAIVAEGVETQTQLDYLKTNNVDYIQGYYYGKPIPLTEFITHYFDV
ncbi:EAL domain-containing protein [Vibrio rumoiensis]|uniref:cyclic-guanylate-specific phosphodiesterase n=1 Tax=Vibrio rumoiensis 1S-45 TaxID=1188252 RepID=A0A1E5DZY4_9VIBR|nr:EAL domain-containing protein [Vibrio rumoiensis]OEF23659.1 hypothetical protein A1QC_11150 [Vibrio rumoiensis 1S-45]